MRRFAIPTVIAAGVLALAGCSASGTDAGDGGGEEEAAAIEEVGILVPADPGGGWDQTGRAMSGVLVDEELVSAAPVTNEGGAGGTVGLASFANERDPYSLMVTGLVMVGAVETNASATRIEDTTPIARLTDEPLVVVVPADSPYDTLEDLVDDIAENGQDVVVTGGSAGGADHILAGLLLTEAGLDSDEIIEKLNYVPNAGGGEAVTMLLGGNADAGISGVGEFAEFVEDGSMRALGVSSEEPAALLPDVPTLVDEGYDVVLTNWRGVLAPGDITDAEAQALTDLMTEMHDSGEWTAVLEENGWTDAFLVGEEFDAFLDENVASVSDTLKSIGLVE
ncbi:Bug family tripartite tricarboxylate transporter substrate binding protein [Microbacterium ureisolvens]|uniref:Tripartite tricarboxylate transporter substrate binding protein n=1 Tax=Microbacterium ureisolvens TaxID=2781186 RepID=A0ABS7I208_9MICO|nr:tripartite tricarboxylate transporter substrate-binding protein [Microbacterium ureisolvens]MBW9111699.1 tripartite tricarboxylate transporter substrate binding protein [Microbacterium ureisolvens]